MNSQGKIFLFRTFAAVLILLAALFLKTSFSVDVSFYKTTCEKEGEPNCLVVDDEIFFGEIEGFDFEPGYEYRLKVEKKEENPEDLILIKIKEKNLAEFPLLYTTNPDNASLHSQDLALSFVEQFSKHYLENGQNLKKNRSINDYGRCESCFLTVIDYEDKFDPEIVYQVYVRVENGVLVEFIDGAVFDVRLDF